MLKNLINFGFIAIVGTVVVTACTGCNAVQGSSNGQPNVVAPDTSKQSVEEKIKMLEKADMPAPAKAAAIEKLKQGK